MKKSLIILSIFLAILAGLAYFVPVTAMGPMSGFMVGHQDDCLMHCLKNSPIDIQNSVPLPVLAQIFAIFPIIFFSIVLTKFKWSINKVSWIDPLYLFKTVNLRE